MIKMLLASLLFIGTQSLFANIEVSLHSDDFHQHGLTVDIQDYDYVIRMVAGYPPLVPGLYGGVLNIEIPRTNCSSSENYELIHCFSSERIHVKLQGFNEKGQKIEVEASSAFTKFTLDKVERQSVNFEGNLVTKRSIEASLWITPRKITTDIKQYFTYVPFTVFFEAH